MVVTSCISRQKFLNHARSKHVVHVYYHITRILGVGEQCKMESTSCDSKLLHARRKVPLVKPSAHLAFRTTRHTDVPPSLGCTPSLSSSGNSKWISRNASACKNNTRLGVSSLLSRGPAKLSATVETQHASRRVSRARASFQRTSTRHKPLLSHLVPCCAAPSCS